MAYEVNIYWKIFFWVFQVIGFSLVVAIIPGLLLGVAEGLTEIVEPFDEWARSFGYGYYVGCLVIGFLIKHWYDRRVLLSKRHDEE